MGKATKLIAVTAAAAALKLAGCAMNPIAPEANQTTVQDQPGYEIPTTDPSIGNPSKFTPTQQAPQMDGDDEVHPDGWLPLVETEARARLGPIGTEWTQLGWVKVYSPNGQWSAPRTYLSIKTPEGWATGEASQEGFCRSGFTVDFGDDFRIITTGECRGINTTSIKQPNRTIPEIVKTAPL